jgi:hypothetical protein
MPVPLGTVSLGGVFEERESLALGEAAEGFHVAELSVEVDRQDPGCPRSDDRRGRVDVDQTGVVLDVTEDRQSAGVDDGER